MNVSGGPRPTSSTQKPASTANAVATAFAVLAGFCVLEVGRGPPLTFIYFRF